MSLSDEISGFDMIAGSIPSHSKNIGNSEPATLPIVTTNVNGIPEMLAPDEAWHTPPGDRYRLAEAIKLALAAHFAGDRRRADKARAAVLRKYHEANSLPQHVALVRQCALRKN